ncbi:MAG: type II toxin-antitoxin system HicA family toxin [Actinomycetota bacterium]|nr:type II toxin-antitoxin system HicA family toxin [Actinomycetota bacterium]
MARPKRFTQRELIKKLEEGGWTRRPGGRHQVKMVKEGERPVTIPQYQGKALPIGLSQAILKQAGVEDN